MNSLEIICKYVKSRHISQISKKIIFFIATFVSTGGFVGNIKYAPGTFGSILGIFLGFFFVKFSILFQFIFLGLILSFSTLAIRIYLIKIKSTNADPKEVVIDEIFAILLTCFFAKMITNQLNFDHFLTIFVLFRTFDIIKPYPISWVDKNIHGAKGIMFDDILASFATILVYICIYT